MEINDNCIRDKHAERTGGGLGFWGHWGLAAGAASGWFGEAPERVPSPCLVARCLGNVHLPALAGVIRAVVSPKSCRPYTHYVFSDV
jgi:hypothetical protein